MDQEEVFQEEVITEEDISSMPQEWNVWNSEATHLLINEYKRFRTLFGNPEIRRRKIWDKIANRLQSVGCNIDAEACEKKWRYLRNYYSINESKNIVTWPYYESMKDALHGEHSLTQKKIKEDNEQHNVAVGDQYEYYEGGGFKQEDYEDDDSAPPAWFTGFLTQFREDEKEKLKMLEEMHQDIVKLEQRKCDLLQTLIDKMA